MQAMSTVHYKVELGRKNERFQIVNNSRLMHFYPKSVDPHVQFKQNLQDCLQSELREYPRPFIEAKLPTHSPKVLPLVSATLPTKGAKESVPHGPPPINHETTPTPSQRTTHSKLPYRSSVPQIIASIPGKNGDCVSFLLCVGGDQFSFSKDEVSPKLLHNFEQRAIQTVHQADLQQSKCWHSFTKCVTAHVFVLTCPYVMISSALRLRVTLYCVTHVHFSYSLFSPLICSTLSYRQRLMLLTRSSHISSHRCRTTICTHKLTYELGPTGNPRCALSSNSKHP